MAKVRVPVHRTSPTQSVLIDAAATVGAQIGVNLLLPDGTVGTLAQLAKLFGSTSPAGSGALTTTDDLDEGQWNRWFTDRRAQDAVGGILADTASIDLAYTAGASITATLKDIADSGTGAALVKITRDGKGRVSGTEAATTTDLAEGINLYFTDSRAATAAPIQSLVAGANVTVDVTDPKHPVVSATGSGGITVHFPFFLASGSAANVALTADQMLPFFLADGSASDIALTT